MKLTGVELRRITMPLVSPFRTSFGTQTSRDVLLLRVVTDEAEGWGECVAMSRPALLLGVRRRGRRRAASVPGARTRCGGTDRRARGGRRAGALQGTPDGQGGAGDGRPRRRAAGRGPVVRARARRGPRTGAVRGLGRDHGQHPGPARRGRRLPRRGLRPDQAQDRARAGTSSRCAPSASGSATTSCSRSTPTRRTPCADARHLARLDPFDLLLIEQPLDEEDVLGHADLARLIKTPGLPRRVDRLGAVRRGRDPARRLPDRQHQARPGRRLPRGAADPRRLRRPRRPGLVRRHARDRPRPRRQRRARGAARLHAARRHLGVGSLLPHRHHRRRSCSTTAT